MHFCIGTSNSARTFASPAPGSLHGDSLRLLPATWVRYCHAHHRSPREATFRSANLDTTSDVTLREHWRTVKIGNALMRRERFQRREQSRASSDALRHALQAQCLRFNSESRRQCPQHLPRE